MTHAHAEGQAGAIAIAAAASWAATTRELPDETAPESTIPAAWADAREPLEGISLEELPVGN